jgi:uncharacterized protein
MIACGLLAVGVAPCAGAELTSLLLPSGRKLTVEVVAKDEERALGLMFRDALPADRGMLFLFETSGFHGIWMKNCRFPIDIVWLDENRQVVHLAESVPPCRQDPCPTYAPLRRARYVLELNSGQARREGALVGATLEFKLSR